MINLIKTAFLTTIAAASALNGALAQDIYSAPNGFYIADADSSNRVLYGPTNTDASWIVSQWGTPGNMLPAFANGTSATVNQRVTWSGSSWEMAISGSNLQCTDDAGHPKEFDAFVSPNDGGWYKNFPVADPGVQGSTRSLGEMQYLQHTIGLTHKFFHLYDSACPNTSGNNITSLTIKNKFDQSTFYYQLRLNILVGTDKAPNGVWSQISGTAGGVSLFTDGLAYYGQSSPSLGERKYYDLNILPRLKSLIAACRTYSGGTCINYVFPDRNLSHWYVRGAYHGTNIWGHINNTSIWDSFSLVEY